MLLFLKTKDKSSVYLNHKDIYNFSYYKNFTYSRNIIFRVCLDCPKIYLPTSKRNWTKILYLQEKKKKKKRKEEKILTKITTMSSLSIEYNTRTQMSVTRRVSASALSPLSPSDMVLEGRIERIAGCLSETYTKRWQEKKKKTTIRAIKAQWWKWMSRDDNITLENGAPLHLRRG